jgi:hypothetical protein
MTQNVEVNPDRLRQAAALMGQIGDALDAAEATLNSTVTQAGKPWSSDEYGAKFYDDDGAKPGYGTSSKNALQDFGDLVDAIREYSANMLTAANDLENADGASAIR